MENIKTENLEKRIIEVAKCLFIENGYENTSMSDIALQVGINRSALHYYFRTKDKMFQVVFGTIVSSFLPKIQTVFEEDIPFTEKLDKILDIYIQICLDNPHLPMFIIQESQRDVNHLISAAENLHLDSYLQIIRNSILDEMGKGILKEIPVSIIFATFYSQMIFPFLTKNIMIAFFADNEKNYIIFLRQWKFYIIDNMKRLLIEKD
ncbi:MAG: TetR/AcrR family transcriptional regulator [Bacteroidaceae bacterium]|nr:TetR/AcrR family transcriptional regulator [Bacteroidaceae bacterium]